MLVSNLRHRNVPLLQKVFALNGIKGQVFEAAIGPETGEIDLYLSDHPDCDTIEPTADARSVVRVPVITVPQVMEKMGWTSIDLLKMDIEGGEKALLSGNNSWLAKVRFIVGESHVHVGYSYAQLREQLAAFGFELETLSMESKEYGATFRGRNAQFS